MLAELCGPFGHQIWPMPIALCFVNGRKYHLWVWVKRGKHLPWWSYSAFEEQQRTRWTRLEAAWRREVIKHKQWLLFHAIPSSWWWTMCSWSSLSTPEASWESCGNRAAKSLTGCWDWSPSPKRQSSTEKNAHRSAGKWCFFSTIE